MQYNSVSDSLGLCQEIDGLCDSNTTSYPVADKTRRVNSALEELVGEIINADGTWQWDDTNNTTLPVGTQTLVASQSLYSFNDKFLQIEHVKVKDVDGVWHTLTPIDEVEFGVTPIEEYFQDTGLPTHYDKVGDDSIKLYPAPIATHCTLTSGLKVNFKRTAHLFAADDTTAEPGLPSTHHILLAYMASIPYCALYHPERVNFLMIKVAEMKKTLLKHFAQREKDAKKRFKFTPINYR